MIHSVHVFLILRFVIVRNVYGDTFLDKFAQFQVKFSLSEGLKYKTKRNPLKFDEPKMHRGSNN